RVAPGDIALLGVATYQLSRTITRDRVTAFLRAPFARQGAPAGRGEVSSDAVGSGLRRALGELATCPFRMTQWIAAAGHLRGAAATGGVHGVGHVAEAAHRVRVRRADDAHACADGLTDVLAAEIEAVREAVDLERHARLERDLDRALEVERVLGPVPDQAPR